MLIHVKLFRAISECLGIKKRTYYSTKSCIEITISMICKFPKGEIQYLLSY